MNRATEDPNEDIMKGLSKLEQDLSHEFTSAFIFKSRMLGKSHKSVEVRLKTQMKEPDILTQKTSTPGPSHKLKRTEKRGASPQRTRDRSLPGPAQGHQPRHDLGPQPQCPTNPRPARPWRGARHAPERPESPQPPRWLGGPTPYTPWGRRRGGHSGPPPPAQPEAKPSTGADRVQTIPELPKPPRQGNRHTAAGSKQPPSPVPHREADHQPRAAELTPLPQTTDPPSRPAGTGTEAVGSRPGMVWTPPRPCRPPPSNVDAGCMHVKVWGGSPATTTLPTGVETTDLEPSFQETPGASSEGSSTLEVSDASVVSEVDVEGDPDDDSVAPPVPPVKERRDLLNPPSNTTDPTPRAPETPTPTPARGRNPRETGESRPPPQPEAKPSTSRIQGPDHPRATKTTGRATASQQQGPSNHPAQSRTGRPNHNPEPPATPPQQN
ncbi:basic proline-rich protein-like [Plectropomus leopardus]|uniref:basic proline-rich protein-like n=1 Tax=Plectropomus leopardus TaxID=160734 RepID=UPI001C4C67CF|nr:basic proline-rich protein-like [Plectropomus leopardus]